MESPPTKDIADLKTALRRDAAARRDALPPDARQAAGGAIAARPFPLPITPGTVVSGFMAMKSEIDPLPLMRTLADAGATLALPVVTGHGQPLLFRQWRWDEPLLPGVWGLREPKPEAAEVEPDVLIVPLLAFDRSGHRLGYGAGYYDNTLACLRARKSIAAIGIGFAAQEVSTVPATARDERLDLVLTEREVIRIPKARLG